MIEAGDFSGRLAEALADAAAELEHEAKIRGELRQSLVYPAFLLVFGCFAILFIFIVVVPRFAVMFQGKFDQLPTLSYVLIGAGMWFHDNLLLALALLALAGISAGYALGRPQSRAALVDLLARLPVPRLVGGDEVARRPPGRLAAEAGAADPQPNWRDDCAVDIQLVDPGERSVRAVRRWRCLMPRRFAPPRLR